MVGVSIAFYNVINHSISKGYEFGFKILELKLGCCISIPAPQTAIQSNETLNLLKSPRLFHLVQGDT